VPPVAVAAFAVIGAIALAAGIADVGADRAARDAVDALADGDTDRALDAATRATSLRPDELRLHLLEGRAAIADERGTLVALAAVDRALDRSPDDPIARLEQASLLVDRARATLVPEHIERARTAVLELQQRDPHNAALWLLAGHAARLAGDTEAAESAWLRAEHLAPRSPAPAAALALMYLELSRTEEAADAAQRALAIDPQDAAAREVQRRLDGS
jgi:tetratricopeptide (TPR) repeat protein